MNLETVNRAAHQLLSQLGWWARALQRGRTAEPYQQLIRA